MQKDQNTEQAASNTTQTNVENQNSYSKTYLIENIEVPNSPFTLTKQNDLWILRAGAYKLSEEYKTKDEALDQLSTHKWEIVCQLIEIIARGITKEEINNHTDYLKKN